MEKIKSLERALKKIIRKIHKINKLILKLQQKIKSKKHNVFTEEVNKIALSANDDKKIQSLESIETNAFGTRRDLLCQKEEIKMF